LTSYWVWTPSGGGRENYEAWWQGVAEHREWQPWSQILVHDFHPSFVARRAQEWLDAGGRVSQMDSVDLETAADHVTIVAQQIRRTGQLPWEIHFTEVGQASAGQQLCFAAARLLRCMGTPLISGTLGENAQDAWGLLSNANAYVLGEQEASGRPFRNLMQTVRDFAIPRILGP
jgi:hypothetical protein